MNFFKSILVFVILLVLKPMIAKQATSVVSSHLRPIQAEPFRNKLIEEYSNQAKSNDRFTNDFIMSVNGSDLTNGQRKDAFEYAIGYYDVLQSVIQANLDKLNNANNAIEISTLSQITGKPILEPIQTKLQPQPQKTEFLTGQDMQIMDENLNNATINDIIFSISQHLFYPLKDETEQQMVDRLLNIIQTKLITRMREGWGKSWSPDKRQSAIDYIKSKTMESRITPLINKKSEQVDLSGAL